MPESKLSRIALFAQALPSIKARLAGRPPFEALLADALVKAAAKGEGFYLDGLVARRALGRSLVIEIDPRRLERRLRHRVTISGKTEVIRDRFVGAGDWEPLLDPLHEASTYRDVRDVVAAQGDYRQTEAYRHALERAAKGQPISRNFVVLKSPQLVEAYFGQMATLAQSIAEQGIVRRAEYRRLSHLFTDMRVRLPWVEAAESDIGIAIGAGGEIYRFAPGKHRTAIAQALGLASIPVETRVVHAKWLKQQVADFGPGLVDSLLKGLQRLEARAT